MAIALDGRDDNLKRKVFTEFAARYAISNQAIHATLDKLLKRFTQHYSRLLMFDMADNKKNLLEKMVAKRLKDLQ